jgi:hypothetical protein
LGQHSEAVFGEEVAAVEAVRGEPLRNKRVQGADPLSVAGV